MSASAAASGLSGISFAGGVFRRSETGENVAHQYGSEFRIESIADLLRYAGRTVTQISIRTRQLYGIESPYFIPPTFIYKLRRGVTPHICQIVALSQCTGYRFVDLMRLLGFDLHHIPRLQVQLHPERTVLVTPIGFEQPSLRSQFLPSGCRSIREFPIGVSPLSSRWGSATIPEASRYCFAKIGRADSMVCPKLFPGMIVRVDRSLRAPKHGVESGSSQNLWLLEQSEGLTCSYLRWIDDDQVVLLPSRPPWGNLPLRLSREARVLGLVDLEANSARRQTGQFNPAPIAFANRFSPPPSIPTKMEFSGLLRTSRSRTGLTFRAAQQLTGAIARILGNPDFAIGLGPLSDYEAMNKLPRHIAKIISLCIVYCLDIRQLLEAAGVYIDDSSKMPLPVALLDSLIRFGTQDYLDSREQYRTTGLGARKLRSIDGFRHVGPAPCAGVVS
jgi:hypothetical protein